MTAEPPTETPARSAWVMNCWVWVVCMGDAGVEPEVSAEEKAMIIAEQRAAMNAKRAALKAKIEAEKAEKLRVQVGLR